MKSYDIAVIGGDGTGPEVTREALKVAETAAKKFGFKLNWHHYDFGGERYLKTGEVLPDSAVEELRKFKAMYLGAIGHPQVKPGILEKGILLRLRFELEQYINLRPVKLYRAEDCPLKDKGPEHIDFVSHLKGDLDVLNKFSTECRDSGWSPAAHEGRMAESEFAICPSCCYHCYEGMENWELEAPGRCTTMAVACHRYEGANHRTMSRLRAFTQRDVVWVGHPRFVVESRAKAEEMIVQWAREWELTGTFETANDMFFTQDYAVKASFQRQQQAKKELRLAIPQEGISISVFSSNFHAMTFGKAFNIQVGGRPASSACVGWGYERWVYALVSQFGLDSEKWPKGLKEEFQAFQAAQR